MVYTARKYQLVDQLFQEYGRERGIEVKSVTDDGAPLIQRLTAEGANSPADMFITVDAGDLWRATQAGLPAAGEVADARGGYSGPPARSRRATGSASPFARARSLIPPARVKPSELSTYAALGDARWKGKLCLRSGKAVYNQSLVAMMIGDIGEEATERLVTGLDRESRGRAFLERHAAAQGDRRGTVRRRHHQHYYLGRLQHEEPDFPVQIFWADQGGRGTHVNISGGGVADACEEPRRGDPLPRMARLARDPAALCGRQLRVPGERRRRAAARGQGLGQVRAESRQRRHDRQDAVRRRDADRPRRLALIRLTAGRR